ncbi:MAG: hypothetical protein LBP52_06490 [Burkholderiaceae bacterium]|nr:hypothetical protein [Burkholderiaceae bacterium]
MFWLSWFGIEPLARIHQGDSSRRYSSRLTQEIDRGAYENAVKILATATPKNRLEIIDGFARNENSVALSTGWARHSSGSPFAHLLAGASLIQAGWDIRGGGYAEDVDSDAWKPFLEHLHRAEEHLCKAAGLDGRMVEPYVYLMTAKMGLGAPEEETDQLFETASARDPLHVGLSFRYFATTTAKWGGSHQKMFGFARNSSRRAPQGSGMHKLIAHAYCEYALAEEKKTLGTIRIKGAKEEVPKALYAWLDATPDNIHDKLLDAEAEGKNYFAVACYLTGATDAAATVIRSLQREIYPMPWGWLVKKSSERENYAFVFNRVCRDLGIYREIANS